MHKISVVVPRNPFVGDGGKQYQQCLAALDVERLMEWWPGKTHEPEADREKVRSIQRSLDWKRVASIAAYLLQREISDVRQLIATHFTPFYNPPEIDPYADWPPRVSDRVGFHPSIYPNFASVLLHVNGGRLEPLKAAGANNTTSNEAADEQPAELVLPPDPKQMKLSVIDGQHRINGAYLALQVKRQEVTVDAWEIPAQIFLDLDKANGPPQHQAAIFIDINFYQKKVDKSLVTDLFPTTRIGADTHSDIERAEDLGRRLMLEDGPLVGMIQIPGIKYGVKGVVTLATLVGAIEDILPWLRTAKVESLNDQTRFLANCLDSWLTASGRKDEVEGKRVSAHNVAYQGRILVSFLSLVPACLHTLREREINVRSRRVTDELESWLREVLDRAGLMDDGKFLSKDEFKKAGYLGSGGIGRFRDRLWAAIDAKIPATHDSEMIKVLAREKRKEVYGALTP
jgi:DGQHR domain-containing protein